VKTKKLINETSKELGVKTKVEETLIDTEEKAKKYGFVGSPTVRINGKDIQEKISKEQCLCCEELIEQTKRATDFVKKECGSGCRIYFYKGKQYPYPPKEMIKESILKNL
jgi:hypothetical protein